MWRRRLLALALAGCATGSVFAADKTLSQKELQNATSALEAGSLSQARTAAIASLDADERNAAARMLLARVYIEQGNGLSAEKEIARAVQGKYPIGQTRHVMGHALFLQGKNNVAIQQLLYDDIPKEHAAYAARIRGRIHVAAGEFEDARQAFDEALETASDSSILWSDIARYRLAIGDIAGSGGAVERALQLDNKNFDALLQGGILARGQYGLIDSIPWFERALEIKPNHVDALLEMAATYGDAGRFSDMLATTRKVLAVDIRNPRAYYLQAVLAARAKKYDLARSLLYRTGEKLDQQPAVILLRSILDIQADNDTQAIIRLKSLIERQPGNLKARRMLGAALARSEDFKGAIDTLQPIANRSDADTYTLSLIARCHEALDQRKEAAWFLERAASPVRGAASPFQIPVSLTVLARANADNPNNADAAVPYITQLVSNGMAGQALNEALRLRRLNPGVPAAHVLVGDSLLALGRPREAADAYKQAANIRFSEGTALRLIKALSMTGEANEALRVLDLYLAQNPRSIPAMQLGADYFLSTRQWDQAIAMLEKMRLRIGNRDAILLNSLAVAYLSKGDAPRGIAYSRAAYAFMPASAAISGTYGWALFSSGFDKPNGLALLEKAAKKQPDAPAIRLRLGQAYAAMGRKAEAKRAVVAALAVQNFPERDIAKKLLATL